MNRTCPLRLRNLTQSLGMQPHVERFHEWLQLFALSGQAGFLTAVANQHVRSGTVFENTASRCASQEVGNDAMLAPVAGPRHLWLR